MLIRFRALIASGMPNDIFLSLSHLFPLPPHLPPFLINKLLQGETSAYYTPLAQFDFERFNTHVVRFDGRREDLWSNGAF